MGLCCSCVEDETRPYGRSSPIFVPEERPWPQQPQPVSQIVRTQPRPQQRQQLFVPEERPQRPQSVSKIGRNQHSASNFLAPATTSTTTTTVRVVQQQSTVTNTKPKTRRTPLATVTNSRNVLVKPGVTVKIAPKSITQQVTIVEVQHCEACGDPDHTKAVCRYRERLCFYCREEGHIISVCPAKKRQQQRKHAQRKRHHTTKRY